MGSPLLNGHQPRFLQQGIRIPLILQKPVQIIAGLIGKAKAEMADGVICQLPVF